MEAKIKQHYTESSKDEDSGVKGFVSFDWQFKSGPNQGGWEGGGGIGHKCPGRDIKGGAKLGILLSLYLFC